MAGDNTGAFALTNHTVITFNWGTQYWLDTEAQSNGSVNLSDRWVDAGSTALVIALPGYPYGFDRWLGDVPEALQLTNPLPLPMDSAKTITASFRPEHTVTVQNPKASTWLRTLTPEGFVETEFASPSAKNFILWTTNAIAYMTNTPTVQGNAWTQFVYQGWTRTGSAPASGANPSFAPSVISR